MTYPNVRAALAEMQLAALELQDPPPAPWERPSPRVYRCWDPQGDVEPFDVQADWEEKF